MSRATTDRPMKDYTIKDGWRSYRVYILAPLALGLTILGADAHAKPPATKTPAAKSANSKAAPRKNTPAPPRAKLTPAPTGSTPPRPAATTPAVGPTAIPPLPPTPPSAVTPAGARSATSALEEKFSGEDFGKLPTDITSDTLTLNSKDRVFTYKGNVTVTQGDMKLNSKTLDGVYDAENRIERLTAKGNVEITKQDIKATAQLAIYDAKLGIVTLTDNPQLQQKESILTADKIRVFLNENRSQAEGSVRVTLINDKQGTSLASPFEGAQGALRNKNQIEATPIPGAGGAPGQPAAGITPKVVVGGVDRE